MEEIRLQKKTISVTKLNECDETAYWRSRTPEERFAAIEMNRGIVYGYGNHPPRLQRILEVIEPVKR